MPDNGRRSLGVSIRLRIRLFGAVDVVLDGRRLSAFNAPRLHRFLALIALRHEPQNRSKLAFEIWPDSSERQARTNLRKLLHEFRQALPGSDDFVEIGSESVRWLFNGLSEVDALRFQDAIASGDFDLAARLYQGDLLPACYDDWVLEMREGFRAEALDVFLRLSEEAAERENRQDTIRYCESAIKLDPVQETAVRLQMEAYQALGDKVAALRTYHHYSDVLQQEFGLSPEGPIERIYLDLATAQPDPSSAEKAEGLSAVEAPFIGRGGEWNDAWETWTAAQAGRSHLLLISGEPGIGKSRLALELGRRVQSDGYAVASARSYEAAGGLPWGPVIDLLRSEVFQSQINSLDAVWRVELARLLPELAETAQVAGKSRSGEVAQRHRLFDAIGRAIRADGRPVMMIIDDLQWCDTETIDMIGYLVRSAPTAPLLIVGTVRSEEITDTHPLAGLIEAMEHDRAVTTIPLERLDQTATATLAAQLSAQDTVEPDIAARLWSETDGIPLFVIETIRADLPAKAGHSVMTPTMRAVLRARLAQLSDSAQQLAEVAAVFGRPFSARAIVAALGVEEQAVTDDLDDLWRRRIFKDQGLKYDFSHDKLRDVALEMINPARRRQLHRVVAEAIASEHHNDLGPVSAQLAAHYDQAGMVEPAIQAYADAGVQAVAVSALVEAVAQFRRALGLLAELPNSSDRDALELKIRIALGSPLVAIEGYGSESSHQLYERAQALCKKLKRPIDPPILRGLGLARLQGCRFEQCSEFAQALVDHTSGDPIAKTEGRYLLGVCAFWRGDLLDACRFLETALENYDVDRRDEHLALYAQDPKAVCLVRLALALLWTGDPGRAGEMARSAEATAADLDHLMTSAYVFTYAAILAAEAEDILRLSEILSAADQLWGRLSERYLVVVLEALRGWLEVLGGSGDGIEKIVQSVARSRNNSENLHLSYTLLLLARARVLRDELSEARAALREGLEWSQNHHQHYLMAEQLRLSGELAYRSGDIDEAGAALREAVERANAQGAHWLELRALHSLAARFPDQRVRTRLRRLVEAIPSGHDLPAFQAAKAWLSETV